MLEYIFNDRLLVTYICPYMWIICSPFVVIFEAIVGIKATYGRYNNNNNNNNGGIPARLAWFIQELPCFIIPCYLLYEYWSSITTTKFLLIGFFLIHYFQRIFIFPMLIRGGKNTSISIMLAAFIYCCIKSYSVVKKIIV